MSTWPVTGTLLDFGQMPLVHPRIVFTPDQAATSGFVVMPNFGVTVTPNMDGSFVAMLQSTTDTQPATFYRVSIEDIGGDGLYYPRADFPDWKIIVPYGGGQLNELLDMSNPNTLLWFAQETEPNPWPVGSIWLNTITGDYFRKDA